MNYKTILFVLMAVILPMACANLTVTIDSEPKNAEVFLKDGKRQKSLGQTPLQIDQNQLGNQSSYNIEIRKEGFQSQAFLIEKRSINAQAEIFANLQEVPKLPNLQGQLDQNSSGQHRGLATIQAQLLTKNYQQAEVLAREFVDANPFSPVGWSLLGNSYLLQNRNQEALDSYKKALEYDPENVDTIKLVDFLNSTPARRER